MLATIAALALVFSNDNDELYADCLRLKNEMNSSPYSSITYSLSPTLAGSSSSEPAAIDVMGFQAPIPDGNFTELAFVSRNNKPSLVVLSDEAQSYFIAFTVFEPSSGEWGAFTYSELLDHAYTITPDELNCNANPDTWVKGTLALLVKGLEFPIKPPETVYRMPWGWLRHGYGHEASQIWYAKATLDESRFLEIRWKLPADVEFDGWNAMDQHRRARPADEALQGFAQCLSQWEATCLNELSQFLVKSMED
ncbi:MAG: hypothetical protein DHS20C11_38020 [Lysobacteraceae bacterium]|nr:MAG: hypothetical protein DHS20C11_38020 [Xanthomonadaceae bacterium]